MEPEPLILIKHKVNFYHGKAKIKNVPEVLKCQINHHVQGGQIKFLVFLASLDPKAGIIKHTISWPMFIILIPGNGHCWRHWWWQGRELQEETYVPVSPSTIILKVHHHRYLWINDEANPGDYDKEAAGYVDLTMYWLTQRWAGKFKWLVTNWKTWTDRRQSLLPKMWNQCLPGRSRVGACAGGRSGSHMPRTDQKPTLCVVVGKRPLIIITILLIPDSSFWPWQIPKVNGVLQCSFSTCSIWSLFGAL